jgi:hypothetical protein
MLPSGSRNFAMPAQQSCSIGSATNLIGRNGINKTLMWKKYVAVEEVRCSRELRRCENVPISACRCQLDEGALVHPRLQTGDG